MAVRRQAGKQPKGAPGPTPTGAQSRVPGPAKSTRTPAHRLPVSGAGPLTMRARTGQPTTTGPRQWENGRDQVSTPGDPGLRGAGPADVDPC